MTLGAFLITQEYLKSVVNYDPETGIFTIHPTYKCRQNNPFRRPGMVVGARDKDGYLMMHLGGKDGKAWFLHRLAFLYMTGSIPDMIDHINNKKDDNRWSNLRVCTYTQNTVNTKLFRSRAGFKGVTKVKRKNGGFAYAASIKQNYKARYLGAFPTPEEAHAAYIAAAIEMHGDFANPGSIKSPEAKRQGFSKTKAHKHPKGPIGR